MTGEPVRNGPFLPLSPAQQTAVLNAVSPLAGLQRHALLVSLAHWLRGHQGRPVGDGELFRTLRELQAMQLAGPAEDGTVEAQPVRPVRAHKRGYHRVR
jgi:hypothetical protein